MEWSDFLSEVMQVCVIPLLGVLTTYIVIFIKNKTQQITNATASETANKYINMLSDTITTCVIATNQTYVNNLKKDNAFTVEAQKEALQMTAQAVKAILSAEATAYLTAIYGDIDALIMQKIEAEVNKNHE